MPAQRKINYTSDPATFDYAANWAQGQAARDAVTREKFGQAAVDRGYNTADEYGEWRKRDLRADTWKNVGRAAAIIGGPIAASYAIPAAASGSVSIPGGASISTAFPAAGGSGGGGMGFSLGKLLGSRGFEAIANGATSLLGLRSQNKTNKYATDANARLMADQTRLEQERLARTDAADTADRADAERRWQAEQDQAKQEYAAAQEQREYQRMISDRQLALDNEREARRSTYRSTYGDPAMRSLGSILGIR